MLVEIHIRAANKQITRRPITYCSWRTRGFVSLVYTAKHGGIVLFCYASLKKKIQQQMDKTAEVIESY
jgi:hypothetical protein